MGILDEEFNLDFDISLEKEPKKIDDASQKKTSDINTLDFSFDIPEDKIEIKEKQIAIGISNILAESERLSFDEFFREFDKKELPATINGELTLFTNELDKLKITLLSGKRPPQDEINIITSHTPTSGSLTKKELDILKLTEKEFINQINNYRINDKRDLDNLKTMLIIKPLPNYNTQQTLSRIIKFNFLLSDIEKQLLAIRL